MKKWGHQEIKYFAQSRLTSIRYSHLSPCCWLIEVAQRRRGPGLFSLSSCLAGTAAEGAWLGAGRWKPVLRSSTQWQWQKPTQTTVSHSEGYIVRLCHPKRGVSWKPRVGCVIGPHQSLRWEEPVCLSHLLSADALVNISCCCWWWWWWYVCVRERKREILVIHSFAQTPMNILSL